MASPTRIKLDRADQRILAALHQDARMTKTQMGEVVGLSPTRCAERMCRMEKMSLIRGYHADIDLRLLARLSFFHVHVRLFDTTPPKLKRFEQCIAEVPEIVGCQAVLGSVDYVLAIVAPSTEDFQVVMDRLASRDSVQFEFTTFPVSRQVKDITAVPLAALLETF